MSAWDERAEAYRTSEAHREGEDLDLLVEWAAGAKTALDVGTGGGHVARRLREAGLEVVSSDPAAGMRADVVAPAEHLPFADGSFDVVASRIAAHHFEDVEGATREMARVARERVLVVDILLADEASDEAERLRDPSHVRYYTQDEWRAFFAAAGLDIEEERILPRDVGFADYLERTGCGGEEADRVRALLGDHVEGDTFHLTAVALNGRKEA
ncbi:MAG TPA: class I SAM-dependent methyltransferase [Gaiellaceae bacterium]|nr:class I SAM-dependent methyltransferase [Gaiellaceae bacterium]